MIQRKCKRCGNFFLAPTPDTVVCPACRAIIRAEVAYRPRICTRCGAEYMGYPHSKYCPECQLQVRRERDRTRRKEGKGRPLGSTDLCAACGKPYVVKSGTQRYCPDCAKTVVPETIRAHKREWMREHPEQAEHKAESRRDRRVCAVCGKTFNSPLPTVTCSPECAEIYRKSNQAHRDIMRGHRSPERLLVPASSKNPQSGITGITWFRGKWMLKIKRKYIGIYPTIEAAAAEKGKREKGTP